MNFIVKDVSFPYRVIEVQFPPSLSCFVGAKSKVTQAIVLTVSVFSCVSASNVIACFFVAHLMICLLWFVVVVVLP